MTEQVYGHIKLPNKIDITDPSYDEDVWCRINNFPINPGEYECYVVTADNDETCGFGERIVRIGIRTEKAKRFERIGMIGVDAGLAGFFCCDNRLRYEEVIGDNGDVYCFDDAFFSSSGYGDGSYDVYAGYNNSVMTDLYIEFIRSSMLSRR